MVRYCSYTPALPPPPFSSSSSQKRTSMKKMNYNVNGTMDLKNYAYCERHCSDYYRGYRDTINRGEKISDYYYLPQEVTSV